ncbi:hypothetical protein P691DRAFT_787087 [Macrolepiota fuliginosa MF-IS2]|uniref:Uncharacterized protein n=1 Tax=Macrolepiota fuliginosa MF-IS2 TaxID=1400762 RepID=A0A9P5XID0_9AGAR|nr:hypothetical protein P691DRAFT_787087 [Macrolepiota fuliginosa MF-IS2]
MARPWFVTWAGVQRKRVGWWVFNKAKVETKAQHGTDKVEAGDLDKKEVSNFQPSDDAAWTRIQIFAPRSRHSSGCGCRAEFFRLVHLRSEAEVDMEVVVVAAVMWVCLVWWRAFGG